MEDKDLKTICEVLLKKGKTWDSVSKSEKKLMERVMDEINKRIPELKKAEAIRKDNAINQSSIAKALGVERKTLGHNNKNVAALIEAFSTNEQKTDVTAERYSHLQAELAEYKSRLDKVLDQEIEAQNINVLLHNEREKVKQKDIQIHNYELENAQLREELDNYRAKELKSLIGDDRKTRDIKTLEQYSKDTKNKS